MNWRHTTPNTQILCDQYAYRYVTEYDNRCEAFVYYLSSCQYSDTVAFWYKDYKTPADAIVAAQLWAMNRGILERSSDGVFTYELADDVHRTRYTTVKSGW